MRPEDIDSLYALFMKREMRKELWTHSAHFVVATCLMFEEAIQDHFAAMRELIRANNEHMGIENTDRSGYHETLTWFYLSEIRRIVAECGARDKYAAIAAVLSSPLLDKNYPMKFYDKSVLFSLAARKSVVPSRLLQYPGHDIAAQ
jgi:hypothetical protein